MDNQEKFDEAKRAAMRLPSEQRRLLVVLLNDMACPECEHWQGEVCGKYNKTPPAKTIANGCPHFDYKVPF